MIKLGLTSRLSILLVCIGVAASGATGYYAYRANRTMLMREAEQSLLTSTQLLSQRFIAALGDVADDVLVLATLPSSAAVAQGGDTSRAGRVRLAKVFQRFMTHHPEYLQIRLITRANYGAERIRTDRDAHGIVIAPDNELREKGHAPYVFDTLATMAGHVYVSPISLEPGRAPNADLGRPTVRIAAPIADASGNKVGVLVIDVDLTQVFNRLERDLPSDYLVYMANEWGDFLVHPDPAQTFGFVRGRRVLMHNSFPATLPLFEHVGATSLTFDGLAHPDQAPAQVFAFVRSPFGLVDGNRFVVLGLARPLANVLASANALGEQIVQMVLISSTVAIVLGALFARALARPLRALAYAAEHVFDDPDARRLPVSRSDEIGVLARCFDIMRTEIHSQMKALRAKQQALTHLAGHDTLTGLPNRLQFMERLETSIRHASLTGDTLAVMFVDLDRFKQINDQLGHSAGDQTLVVIAQRLSAVLRSNEAVARLGGDEFIMLVPGVQSPEAIGDIADRVLAAMDDTVAIGPHRVSVGASIGISEFPVDGSHADELLAKADTAMYAAKTSNLRRYVRYQELAANDTSPACGQASLLAQQ